ncbi:MFS transporter [Spongiibacter sp. KMU-166]|uniref:MFS transporter n=1 Tax=Spongiibacter thalassae TaxID=2721624 RepID=A0ABX1GAF9_9GAMM|nr:MFS transporter [Spongiibacter thalassae]NKI15916.1 MFS transporter [Spongiibacter thalassae]
MSEANNTRVDEQEAQPNSQKDKIEPGIYRWYVLGMLVLVYAFSYMDRQIVSILLEDLRLEFAMTDTQLGLLSGLAFALFYATLGVPIARLADRSNRVRIVAIAVAVWSGMTAICGLAGSFWQLFLARVGVGVGEAGGGPPSLAIISDYFGPKERALATSIYAMGPVIGGFVGLAAGGWVAQEYGWRWAFFVMGLPGIALALLLYTTVREPVRGALDSVTSSKEENFLNTILLLLRNRLWLWLILGQTFAIFVGYGFSSWKPSLYLRQFDLSQAEVGSLLGIMSLLAGAPSMLAGGFLGDRLIAKSLKLAIRCIAFAALLVIPFYGLALMQSSWLATTLLLGVGLVFYSLGYGTALAIALSAVAANQRALAASFGFLSSNLLGLGLGPLLIGVISDAAVSSFGDDSLGFSLGVCLLSMVISFACYWAAANEVSRRELNA